MPAESDSSSERLLTLATRKQLLLVACTIDRLDLVAAWPRPSPLAAAAPTFARWMPWVDLGLRALGTRLPRPLRLAGIVAQFIRRMRR